MILRKATIVTMNEAEEVFMGDLRIDGSRIVEVAPHVGHRGEGEEEIDARGCIVLPGFVQAHVHLCQTLMRNAADGLELMDWLRARIWPYEAWLDAGAMRAAARLAILELLSGGTTAVLDMGSVHHTGVLFEEAERSGIRYTGGKCLMDQREGGVPEALLEDPADALAETERLAQRWHGAAEGRLRYAVAPRFAVSCSEDLLHQAGDLACARGLRIHTHASESTGEVELVRRRTQRENVDYLCDVDLLGSHVTLAHCIHVGESEVDLLFGTGTHVTHCPSSNLKLASGIAAVPRLLDYGINVALGADGAACNNRLSMFREMLLASLIQTPRHGPRAMDSRRVLRMATMGGARALGLEDDIGSLEPGKLADVIVLDLEAPETAGGDPISAVVYSADPANVRDVFVGGRAVKRDFEMMVLDPAEVAADAEEARGRMQEELEVKT